MITINPAKTEYAWQTPLEISLKGQIGEVQHKNKVHDNSLKIKTGITAGLGILTGLTLLSKGKFNPLNPKTWKNYLKIDHTKNIIPLAGTSILGGLLGGIAFDKKENLKPKLKESISQMVGNFIVPVTLVTGVHKLTDKFKLADKMPQLKGAASAVKRINGSLKMLPQVGLSIAALAVGIVGGNFLANKINGLIFDKDAKREVRLADLSGHMEDICMVSALVAPENKFCHFIGNFIPPLLGIAGISVGTADNNRGHKH